MTHCLQVVSHQTHCSSIEAPHACQLHLIIGRTAFSECILQGGKRNGSWRVLNRDCRKDKNELIQNADFCSKTWLVSSRTLKDLVSRILVEISQPSDMCKLKTVKEGIQRVQSNMKLNLSPPPACCGLFSLVLVPIFLIFRTTYSVQFLTRQL